MVTEAGKELLRNTINTAKFHNRILEENEMWKQWELERGLTMMVSDDLFLSKSKKHHQCSKHRKRSASRDYTDVVSNKNCSAGSSKDVDRWDHSGYRELYPDASDNEIYHSPAAKGDGKKLDYNGYKEDYPDKANWSPASAIGKKWNNMNNKKLYADMKNINYCSPAAHKGQKWDYSGYKIPDETDNDIFSTASSEDLKMSDDSIPKALNHDKINNYSPVASYKRIKWDCSGFKEYNTDETDNDSHFSPASASDKEKKWDDNSHKKVYSEKTEKHFYGSAAVSRKRKKWDHKRHKELYPNEVESDSDSSPGVSASSAKEKKWDDNNHKKLYPVKVDRNIYYSPTARFRLKGKKWDHSGYKELYPDDEDNHNNCSPAAASTKEKKWGDKNHKMYADKLDSWSSTANYKGKKWDHSGYLELYPDEALNAKQSSSRSKESSKPKKKRKKHHKEVSNSDNEIWEEFKTYKRSKATKKSKTGSCDRHSKERKRLSKTESSKM